MQLTDVFISLGNEAFAEMLRSISMGKLKTYQLFDRLKARTHLTRLNSEHLHKASARLWQRIGEGDDELARDLSQAILICHLDMIVAVLDFLGVPHQDGFFAKELDAAAYFKEGWCRRVLDHFQGRYPEALLRFYTDHLAWELNVAK